MDEPYPDFLPTVDACEKCNQGFSEDEEYLACFIECVVCGSTDPDQVQRSKVASILREKPRLRSKIEAAKQSGESDELTWVPENARVREVVLKLARGHAAYEIGAIVHAPVEVQFVPLIALSSELRSEFEHMYEGTMSMWPEIGTRAFFRAAGESPDGFQQIRGWVVVQSERYRYSVSDDGLHVRMVLSEYLACSVVWDVE